MRLLIIEGDQKTARVLAKGLREEGFVVDIAPKGSGSTRYRRRETNLTCGFNGHIDCSP
jgi:DNA-binding response OmpR family regulator